MTPAIKTYFLLAALISIRPGSNAQHISTDLHALGHRELVNRTASTVLEKSSVRLNEAPGPGLMILKDADNMPNNDWEKLRNQFAHFNFYSR